MSKIHLVIDNEELLSQNIQALIHKNNKQDKVLLYDLVKLVCKDDDLEAFQQMLAYQDKTHEAYGEHLSSVFLPLIIRNSSLQCLKELDKAGVNFNSVNHFFSPDPEERSNALFYAIDYSGSTEIIEFILNTSVDINHFHPSYGTVLHRAIQYQDCELLSLLLEYNPQYQYEEGTDLLTHANIFFGALLADLPPKNHFELLVRHMNDLEVLKDHYRNLQENIMGFNLDADINKPSMDMLRNKINILEQKALLEKTLTHGTAPTAIHKI